MERDVVLERFRHKTAPQVQQQGSSPILTEGDWRKMRRLVEDVIKDGAEAKAKKITYLLHHL
tara:strand:+ start:5406 stop:5591 length:186 start_codon:yes stop_codon:yes gene_type:complete